MLYKMLLAWYILTCCKSTHTVVLVSLFHACIKLEQIKDYNSVYLENRTQ